jgi:hypothetical protein
MSVVAWGLVFICTLFLIIWMALTFTNQFCTGAIGFGLCYNSASDPACPVCPAPVPVPAPAPVQSPSPAPAPVSTPGTTSSYEPEPYFKE